MASVNAVLNRNSRRLRLCAAIVLLLATAACDRPPELDRPLASATTDAASLLPPGQSLSTNRAGAEDAAGVTTTDGGRITALRFPSESAAQHGYDRIAYEIARRPDIGARRSVSIGTTRYVRYSGRQNAGLAWLSGVWVFSAEAADDAKLGTLISASRVGGIPADSFVGNAIAAPGALIGVGIAVIAILLAVLLPGRAMKGLTVGPVPGARVLAREQLVARLMTLNDANLPYVVRSDAEADLVVEWKFADAKWWVVLAREGVSKAYRLRLYFDESAHRASALDEFGEVEWIAGLTIAPKVHFQKTLFRGVVLMRRERGIAYGFQTPTGGGFGKALDYKFDAGWLKDRIAAEVANSGWTYQPVLRAPR